ncbi:MAG: hypothetical protein K8J08_19770 [Thermoanaerobaculia bacterium]|nr:hypothetical protein [Thermoanaerobaculia bacterium]
MTIPSEFVGDWKITEMAEWEQDYVDLVRPGFVRFESNGQGEFQFGTVSGWLEAHLRDSVEAPTLDWSWQGMNDADPGCGRGWVRRKGQVLAGHIFIHGGDHSGFLAAPMSEPGSRERSRHARER